MDPRIFSPSSPGQSLAGTSFDDSMTYSSSVDSLFPLIAAHDSSGYDAYLDKMVGRDIHKHPPSMSPIRPPTPSELEEPLMDDSPSQATITQAARSSKLKKKRSLGHALKSFKSSSRDLTESLKGSKRVPFPMQFEDTSILTIGSENLPGSIGVRLPEEKDVFDDRNRTVRRRNMPHHPFRSEDVPYMQAYNQVLLENDFQTHHLLCRLIRTESPTFHKFGKRPPSDVLDLGCGEGFWVLHAARLWKWSNTKVTGLDLIDVHNNEVGEVSPSLEPAQPPKNVTWRRANFVKHALPFPDNSFDLVRMANLTLCIPITRWKFVLSEVRRVLKAGGRLELIDDDLFYPPILSRPGREVPRSPSKRPQWQRTISASDVLLRPRTPSFTQSLSPSDIPSPHRSPGKKGHSRTQSDVEFSTDSTIGTHLETVFENMLVEKYGITPHPHMFLGQLLHEVFGHESARQTEKLELAVPSREMSESWESPGPKAASPSFTPGHAKRHSEDEKHKAGWALLDREKRSRAPSPIPGLPSSPAGARPEHTSEDSINIDPRILGSLTPKARQLLFGDGDNLHKTPSWRASGPYQPPGLVLLPATLIPCSPLELEMHACKHMNTLLGCRYAIGKWVAGLVDRDGVPLLTESEMDGYLWDYECFRRKRFNWPQDIPGLQMEEEPEEVLLSPPVGKSNNIFKLVAGTPPSMEANRAHSTGGVGSPMLGGASVNRQSSTHVRTIRVYEAVKTLKLLSTGRAVHEHWYDTP